MYMCMYVRTVYMNMRLSHSTRQPRPQTLPVLLCFSVSNTEKLGASGGEASIRYKSYRSSATNIICSSANSNFFVVGRYFLNICKDHEYFMFSFTNFWLITLQ